MFIVSLKINKEGNIFFEIQEQKNKKLTVMEILNTYFLSIFESFPCKNQ